ncbi:MAG: ferritin-like domain-containing protein [Gaiellaceae bacterium]
MLDQHQSQLAALEELDRDGAVREAADKVDAATRTAFLKKAGVGLGTIALGGAFAGGLPAVARGQAIPQTDLDILNFALTLEFLESAFYAEAVENRIGGRSVTNRFARVVANHESSHVRFLQRVLGMNAVTKPRFDFRDTTSNLRMFQATADLLEHTGVHAYLGQAGNIESAAVLMGAARILPVEARHAAWIRAIRFPNGRPGTPRTPAPAAFEDGFTREQILALVNSTGFIVSS